MNLALRDQGIYVSHFPAWANALTAYLDFPWFLALTGWSLVLMLWWWRPRAAALGAWGWLPWSASGGVLITLVHLSHLVFSRVEATPNGPFLFGDLALGFLIAGIAAGWWWAAADTPRARHGAIAIAALLLIFAALRHDFWTMVFPSSVLAAVSFFAAWPWLFHRHATAWSRLAVIAAALTPLFSTAGPLAWGLSMIERYTALNPVGLVTATTQALAALLALGGFARALLLTLGPAQCTALRREARPFALAGTAWAALMLTAAFVLGERQRLRTHERALEQVRVPARNFNPDVLAPIASPRFQLDNIPVASRNNNAPIRTAWSDYLATGAADRASRAFADIAATSRTALYVRFITLRGGWLGAPFNLHTPREGWVRRLVRSVAKGEGRVLLIRQPTPADQRLWNNRTEHIEGPLVSPIMANSHVFVRAPIVDATGAMLGWLEFTHMADTFYAETIQSRFAPLLGLALGSVVAGLFFVQHRQARAREAALRAATLSAESNRIKTAFLAKVSHELRTPLQSISGYGELLQADLATAAGRQHLAALRQQSGLMLRLVNDLLDLGAMEAGQFRLVEKPAPLATLVRDTVETLRPRAESKRLALHHHAAPDIPAWAATDAERLRQIVLNLVGNAVKFTAAGRIDVSLRLLSRDPDDRSILELAVTDTGPGITPADQAKLFQPFSRLELAAPQEGSGLGLALTAALCRSFGGSLDVESDGQSGSCFRARFTVRPCVAPAPTATPAPFTSLRGRRILIADDNALVRQLFAAHLSELGAACEFAADGQQALAQILAGNFDALVLDFAMPRLDGPAVARQIRATGRPGLRIVGVSAHAATAAHTEALAAGMDAFLAKPVELAALSAALTTDSTANTAASEKFSALRETLAAQFRTEAPAQSAAIAAALCRRDWPALTQLAHHLKSSAGVIQDQRLYEACTALEDAADSADTPAANSAWQTCSTALAPWL